MAAHARRGFVSVVLALALLALAGAGAGWWWWTRPGRQCDEAIADRRHAEVAAACLLAFERSGEGRFVASAALGHLGANRVDEAWELANRPAALDEVRAYRVRGVILKVRRQPERSREVLGQGLRLALDRGEHGEASRLAHAMAGLQWEQGLYTAAWRSLDVSEREARLAGDGPALALAELARGDVLRKLGDAQRADEHYRRALESSAPWPTDHCFAQLKVGLWLQDRGAHALAKRHLQQALLLAQASKQNLVLSAARSGLATTLLELGELDDAERQLDAHPNPDTLWVQVERARLTLVRGQYTGALSALQELAARPMSDDDRWEVATFTGEAAVLAGDPIAAERAWTQAIELVETLTEHQPEHQGWVVASRRRPFDALFAHYIRAGEAQKAWEVVARYARAEALSLTDEGEADLEQRLQAAEAVRQSWAQIQTSKPPAAVPSRGLRTDELLVLHEAEGRLWVGTRRGGQVRWVDAGAVTQLEPWLHAFLGDPGSVAAAEGLGSAIWEAAGLQPSPAPLHVLSTGRLRRLALAALRHQGQYWIQLRPLELVSARAADGEAPAVFDGPPIVAGDPLGNLPGAREELGWVAQRVGSRPLVGGAATAEAVLAAKGAALLHLATHSEVSLDGARLVLADGALTAQEVLRRAPSAKVVVLASCASAVGRDAGGSDSLATAFLRAGSSSVLATLRTVPDEAAQQVVRAFYEHGGLKDPAAALARAQAQVAPTQPVSAWSAFVLVGRATF